MSDLKDFIITKNNILKEYIGQDTEIVVPDSVQSIGEYVFSRRCGTVHLPDSVTSIRTGAFEYWRSENEKSFVLPPHLKSIGSLAFYASHLPAVTIPGTVRKMEWCAFSRCDVETVVVEKGVKEIGNEVFSECQNLTTLALPSTIRNIHPNAFVKCANICKFILPTDVKAFAGSALELIWNYFGKGNYKPHLVMAFVIQLPELVCADADLSKKIKANKSIVMDYAIANDTISVIKTLFKLYKKVPIDLIDQYIDKSIRAVSVRSFLLEYKNEHDDASSKKKETFHLPPVRAERTLTEWKEIYTFDTKDDTVVIKGYKGSDVNVVIPAMIGKYQVVGIGQAAFSPRASGVRADAKAVRTNLLSVVLPDSVLSIGDEAFAHCSRLAQITLPKNVSTIGSNAFDNCRNLKAIDLSKSLERIGDAAFNSCIALSTLTIPSTVTELGKGIFRYCNKLETISVEDGNSVYHSVGNCLIETASGTLLRGQKCSTLPAEVTAIAEEAFIGCRELTSLVIPNSVTTIGAGAFIGCEKLSEVTLPEGLSVIDEHTFSGCDKLTSLVIPDGVTAIGDWAFNSCKSLTNITLPNNLKIIGSKAFYYCKKLSNVVLPESITKIADWSFSGCESLTEITIPSKIKSISKYAFVNCNSLQTVVIQNGVKKICEGAFADCKELKKVFIPDSVTEIYSSRYDTAFKGCDNLAIHAPAGSYAEKFAKENNIPFVAE